MGGVKEIELSEIYKDVQEKISQIRGEKQLFIDFQENIIGQYLRILRIAYNQLHYFKCSIEDLNMEKIVSEIKISIEILRLIYPLFHNHPDKKDEINDIILTLNTLKDRDVLASKLP